MKTASLCPAQQAPAFLPVPPSRATSCVREGEMAEAPAAHPVSAATTGRKICKAENLTNVLPQKQHRPLSH